MKKVILGVKIDDISMDEAISIVDGWLSKPGPVSSAKRGEKYYIVTTNPEFLVTAQNRNRFRMILNRADLSIPDGKGLRLGGVKNNIPGVDFMEELVKLAAEKGYIIGLLGGRDGVADRAAECLLKKYPKLKINFAFDGGKWNVEDRSLKVEDGRLKESSLSSSIYSQNTTLYHLSSIVKIPKTDILFVAFGHPKQEFWIAENLDKIPVKIAMGVGGAFDFLSGKVPRAPKWIRDLWLEWLFRLIVQPWRIKRQIALLKYIWYMLQYKHG